MGVTKTIRVEGTGPQPVRGQTVRFAYTGWLKDTSKPDNKGQESVQSSPVQSTRFETSGLSSVLGKRRHP